MWWNKSTLKKRKGTPGNMWDRAPFHYRFFHRNSNAIKISLHSHLDSNILIATKCCTWHDSCAFVACAKNCCDLRASNGITARRIFQRIWIAGKKIASETGPCTSNRLIIQGTQAIMPMMSVFAAFSNFWFGLHTRRSSLPDIFIPIRRKSPSRIIPLDDPLN